LPLYSQPGPDWIPFVYPPGYAALLAALSAVFPLDYALGRAVSIAGTLAAAALAAFLVGRRGNVALGVAVAGVFLGCWRASGAFYDLVRPDGLAIALLAASVVAARERARWAGPVAGVFLCLAFVVKHHSAAFGVPLALWLLLRDGWRPALVFGLVAAIPGGLFTLGMQLATEGRFLAYLIDVPASHPTDAGRVFPGVPGELGLWLAPSLVAGALWLLATMPALRLGVPRPALWALPALGAVAVGWAIAADPVVRGVQVPDLPIHVAAGAAIGAGAGAGLGNGLATALRGGWRAFAADEHAARWWACWGFGAVCYAVVTLMRGHNGGFLNVLMPAHWALAVGLGLVVDQVRRALPDWRVTAVTAAAVLLQVLFVSSQLEVEEVIPTEEDRVAGEEVLERLRECPEGPILSLYASWLPVQVGRAPSPHLITVWDVDHPDGPFRSAVSELRAAARAHRWPCVVGASRQKNGYGVDEAYVADTTFRFTGQAMLAKTGWRVRVGTVYVPRGGEPP
jgi:hypothetical protein